MAIDSRTTSRAQQCAEGILKRLNDYVSIRFDQAIRINPRLKTLKHDLMYHEMENVRTCLMSEKIYGTQRLVVGMVLMSDDDRKRKGLMTPSDQTTIQVELVSHVREDVKNATRGQIKIHDLKTFYAAIDPALTDMMDLIETWIWWDIYDASELSRFEQKLGIIQLVRQGRCSPELRKYYGALIAPPAEGELEGDRTVTDDEIIQYEFGKLNQIYDNWKLRRSNDHGYMFVLQRDELPAPNQGEMIHQIAERVREYDRFDAMTELDEETRQVYAPILRVAPAKVTREMVLENLRSGLVELEREMLSQADDEANLGVPYRYKVRQQDFMEKWVRDLESQVKIAEPQTA